MDLYSCLNILITHIFILCKEKLIRTLFPVLFLSYNVLKREKEKDGGRESERETPTVAIFIFDIKYSGDAFERNLLSLTLCCIISQGVFCLSLRCAASI